jgi:hypothetical protein
MAYDYDKRGVWYRYIALLCAKPLSRFAVVDHWPSDEYLRLRRLSDGATFDFNGGDRIEHAAYNVLGGRWQ